MHLALFSREQRSQMITSSTLNDGGYLFQSSNNLIDHCTFNGQGAWMDFSPYNTLRNNSVIGGDFSVSGDGNQGLPGN